MAWKVEVGCANLLQQVVRDAMEPLEMFHVRLQGSKKAGHFY